MQGFLSDCSKHERARSHIQAYKMWKTSDVSERVGILFMKAKLKEIEWHDKEVRPNREMLRTLSEAVLYLAKQELRFTAMMNLLQGSTRKASGGGILTAVSADIQNDLCADMDDADISDFEDVIKQCDSTKIEQVLGETENPDVAVLKMTFQDIPEATIKEELDLSDDSMEMAASSLVSWYNNEASSSSSGLTRTIPTIDVDAESPENSKEAIR